MPGVVLLFCYAECQHAERHGANICYTECLGTYIGMLSVAIKPIMLNVIILNVIMQSVLAPT